MPENTDRRIKTDLSMVGEIINFHMVQETNAHGSCILEGIVADGCGDEFARENNSDKRVKVTAAGQVIFAGIIGELSISQDGGLYRFKIRLYSATFLMDLEQKSRSFQDVNMTYGDLIHSIISEYEGGDILDRLSDGKKLGRLLIQYRETDWEFLKRLASHFNGSLAAACEFDTPKVFFGAKKPIQAGTLEQYAYSMEKQFIEYRRLTANGFPGYMQTDATWFTVEAREYYELGASVSYHDIPLYIGRIEAKLNKGEAMFHYQLRTECGMGSPEILADRLAGLSLRAEVLEAVKDKIKVKLEIDGTQSASAAWEFPYQTMYTAGSAGGWYCMPEKGDQVMVHFPSGRETDGVGTASQWETDGHGGGNKEPAIKFFRTIYGKEIRFTPSAVEIICEDRSGGGVQTKITLHQDNGIELYSRDGITLSSGAGIKLEAEDEIELAASERIRLHCKKSRIQMDAMVDIAGPDVRIN